MRCTANNQSLLHRVHTNQPESLVSVGYLVITIALSEACVRVKHILGCCGKSKFYCNCIIVLGLRHGLDVFGYSRFCWLLRGRFNRWASINANIELTAWLLHGVTCGVMLRGTTFTLPLSITADTQHLYCHRWLPILAASDRLTDILKALHISF